LFWEYTKSVAIFRCPDVDTNAAYFKLHPQKMTDYVMNGSAIGYASPPAPKTYKRMQYAQDSIMFWQPDELVQDYGIWNDASNYPWEGGTRIHNDGQPVGGIDGHVEYWRDAKWYAWAGNHEPDITAYPHSDGINPGLLWNTPR
jgi:hypothetical protein